MGIRIVDLEKSASSAVDYSDNVDDLNKTTETDMDVNKKDDTKLDLTMAIQALENMNLANTSHEDELWALAAEDNVLKSRSWRRSLVLLKNMYPDPGSDSKEKQTSANMFHRLSEMRNNMEFVLNRNAEKLRELRQGILASAENRVNLYASQICAPDPEPPEASVDSLALLEMRAEEQKLEEESTLIAWSGDFPQTGNMKLIDEKQEAKMKKKFEDGSESSTVDDLHAMERSSDGGGSIRNSP